MTAELRTRFRGALLRPGEEGYEEARRVWNGAVDRRPALIARCAGADDVVQAVRFARDRDLPVSVRGGGHAVAGHAVVDGGLMIDLSLMKAVLVDPEERVARAAGGLLWRELDGATQQFGLATTGGIIGHTGIGGLTLGGGLGHLMRKHGLTVDNLLAVDLVTAGGERLRVDAEADPELLWGLRGGGGNFGIAIAFEYRLHPVGPMVLGGPVVWAVEDAARVLRFLRDFAPGGARRAGRHHGHDARPTGPVPPAGPGRQAGPDPGPGMGRRPRRRREGDRPPARAGRADRRAGATGAVCGVAVGAGRRRPPRPALLLEVAPPLRAPRRRRRGAGRAPGGHHLAVLPDRGVGHGRSGQPGRPGGHRRRRA
jgi:hypothetical protein